MSYDTVRRWKNENESGVESTKNAPKSGRPKYASSKISFQNKGSHCWRFQIYSSRYCTKSRHINIDGLPYFEEAFESPNIFARWLPHLLTDKQNRQRV